MKKTGSFSHFKNIFLDRTRMDELYTILVKYSQRLMIQAKTIDDSSIEFESYDELMEYTNFKKGRIKKLEICGYPSNSWDRVFTITFCPDYSDKYSVECRYNFSDLEKETVFCKDVQDLLNKASSLYIPAFIGKYVSYCLICIILFYWLVVTLQGNPFVSCLVFGIAAVVSHSLFLHFIWYKLFPLVSFSWGESTAYYARIATWRSSLFWCVIVAFIIGIIVAFVSNGLFSI